MLSPSSINTQNKNGETAIFYGNILKLISD